MNGELVAGGVPTSIAVLGDPLDVGGALEFAADPAAGCTLLFVGTVRDHAPGKTGVSHLEYEAYAGVVESKIAEVVAEAPGVSETWTRADFDAATWDRLDRFARRTYAPATEASRLKGAGAGLTDND